MKLSPISRRTRGSFIAMLLSRYLDVQHMGDCTNNRGCWSGVERPAAKRAAFKGSRAGDRSTCALSHERTLRVHRTRAMPFLARHAVYAHPASRGSKDGTIARECAIQTNEGNGEGGSPQSRSTLYHMLYIHASSI